MRFPAWPALILVGTTLTHCRHDTGPRSQQVTSLSTPTPDAIETLTVPALADLRGQRLEQLRVSANGALLFTRWALPENTFDFRVVHLPTGSPLWSGKTVSRSGPWTLALSPDGSAGFVFLPLGPEAPFILFRLSAPPLAMTDVEFTGGAWASGGKWFGGSSGAYAADGKPRGKPIPHWQEVQDELFLPGVRPDTVRYMDAGNVFEWNGLEAPSVVGSWACSAQVSRHRLSPTEPVGFSPDGRFIAWHLKDTQALTLCDGESGEDIELASGPTSAAWLDRQRLWWISGGSIVGRNVIKRQALACPPLPDGEKAIALAASIQPPALFVGTDKGRLLRISIDH
jgi:hypothetical protein